MPGAVLVWGEIEKLFFLCCQNPAVVVTLFSAVLVLLARCELARSVAAGTWNGFSSRRQLVSVVQYPKLVKHLGIFWLESTH